MTTVEAKQDAASAPIPRQPDAATFGVVAVVAFSTLALQVLLTRILAALVFYHFSFLAISLALLGTGAGGLYVSLRQPPPNRFALRVLLSGWAAVLAVTLTLVPVVIVRLNFDYSDGLSPHFVFAMTVACVVSALPSFAAGVVIAMAIRAHAQVVGRIYAVDLVAAGLGALLVVPAIWLIDPPHLAVALGLLAAVTAIAVAPDLRARRWAGLAGVVPAAVLIAAPLTSILTVPVPGLDLAGTIRSEVWTPLSRVIGVIPHEQNSFGLVFYDRVSAPVINYAPGEPSPDWRVLQLGPQTIPSELGRKGKALIIGGGGGRDIHNLRSSGVDDIDVIELNEGIRQIVDDEMAVFSGSPYSLPGVHTTIGDGRSILARRGLYDQIQISFTDSLSAGGAAAYALSENNLYTVEAFQEYLDHLAPGGVLAVTRRHQLVGDEALRATVLALETLRHNGVEHPEQNVVVVLGRDLFNALFGTVLVKNEPFTPDELAQITKLAAERGDGVAFAPGGPYSARVGRPRRRGQPQRVLPLVQARRVPTDRRPAVLLQHEATGRRRSADDGLLVRGRSGAHPLPHVRRDPGAVGARLRGAPAARAPHHSPAARCARVLRAHRARVPARRSRVHPAVRADAGLPDVFLVGGARRVARVHRSRFVAEHEVAERAPRAVARADGRDAAHRGVGVLPAEPGGEHGRPSRSRRAWP